MARIEVNHDFDDEFKKLRSTLLRMEKLIMTTQAELAAQLSQVGEQLAKIGAESSATLQKVVDLEAALVSAGNVTPELQAAFDALKAQVQLVDDLVPDAP